MALIDELKEMRERSVTVRGREADKADMFARSVREYNERIAELDIAIAALKAADDHAYFAEQETAREQLEREPEIEPVPIDEQDDASEFAESDAGVWTQEELDAAHERAEVLAAQIAPLWAGDPAIEPESGLHGEPLYAVINYPDGRRYEGEVNRNGEPDGYGVMTGPAPDPEFVLMDEQTCEPVSPLPQPEWNEPEPVDGYAPVTSPEADAWSAPVETTPGALAEYTPPTNPDADALVRAQAYYDPKAVAERSRYNPFGIFGKKLEDA